MSIRIDVDYSQKPAKITLPFSTKQNIDVEINPLQEKFTIGVSNFPLFIKNGLEANMMLVRVDMTLNMLSQRLIVDTDPLIVNNIDALTLGELDIGQDVTFYSVW